jgi:hypothetical protein
LKPGRRQARAGAAGRRQWRPPPSRGWAVAVCRGGGGGGGGRGPRGGVGAAWLATGLRVSLLYPSFSWAYERWGYINSWD